MLVRAEPFHCTVDDGVKRAPVTVRVNWAAPVVVAFGEMEAMLGPVTETDAEPIAPDKAIPMPDDRDGWAVLKNPIVVVAETAPEIWENITSTVAPLGRVEGTYATSVGNR